MNDTNAVPAYAAITDWLNFTFEVSSKPEFLTELFVGLFKVLGERFAPAVDSGRGLLGYKRAFTLGSTGAMFAVGGQRGTALISMPGQACALVKDWHAVIAYFGDLLKGRITRWDGAVDDFKGIHSLQTAINMYSQALFNTGGNKPSTTQVGNWLFDDGTGRTLNIGKRKNGKMIRIYEKRRQLGRLYDDWVRWEVELHNRDRAIPWEVLIRPGHYFVGAYPKALYWVQTEMNRIKTIKKTSEIGYEHLAEYASIAYGALLNVMQQVEGSPEEAFKKLVRHGAPKRLRHPITDRAADLIDAQPEL